VINLHLLSCVSILTGLTGASALNLAARVRRLVSVIFLPQPTKVVPPASILKNASHATPHHAPTAAKQLLLLSNYYNWSIYFYQAWSNFSNFILQAFCLCS